MPFAQAFTTQLSVLIREKNMRIEHEIEKTKAELDASKPKSARNAVLHSKLRMLRLKQLRSEIRMKKRAAASVMRTTNDLLVVE